MALDPYRYTVDGSSVTPPPNRPPGSGSGLGGVAALDNAGNLPLYQTPTLGPTGDVWAPGFGQYVAIQHPPPAPPAPPTTTPPPAPGPATFNFSQAHDALDAAINPLRFASAEVRANVYAALSSLYTATKSTATLAEIQSALAAVGNIKADDRAAITAGIAKLATAPATTPTAAATPTPTAAAATTETAPNTTVGPQAQQAEQAATTAAATPAPAASTFPTAPASPGASTFPTAPATPTTTATTGTDAALGGKRGSALASVTGGTADGATTDDRNQNTFGQDALPAGGGGPSSPPGQSTSTGSSLGSVGTGGPTGPTGDPMAPGLLGLGYGLATGQPIGAGYGIASAMAAALGMPGLGLSAFGSLANALGARASLDPHALSGNAESSGDKGADKAAYGGPSLGAPGTKEAGTDDAADAADDSTGATAADVASVAADEDGNNSTEATSSVGTDATDAGSAADQAGSESESGSDSGGDGGDGDGGGGDSGGSGGGDSGGGYARGGMVRGGLASVGNYTGGGAVDQRTLGGPNPPGRDDGTAFLDGGEFVTRAAMVPRYQHTLEQINAGTYPPDGRGQRPGYADGGIVAGNPMESPMSYAQSDQRTNMAPSNVINAGPEATDMGMGMGMGGPMQMGDMYGGGEDMDYDDGMGGMPPGGGMNDGDFDDGGGQYGQPPGTSDPFQPPGQGMSISPEQMLANVSQMPPDMQHALAMSLADPSVLGALSSLLGDAFMPVLLAIVQPQQQMQGGMGMGGGQPQQPPQQPGGMGGFAGGGMVPHQGGMGSAHGRPPGVPQPGMPQGRQPIPFQPRPQRPGLAQVGQF